MTVPKPRHFCIAFAIALYLFFSLTYLDLPGLEYDELIFANIALGNLDGTCITWQIHLLGKYLPLMIMKYIGALKSFLYAPIFLIFGTSAASVRVPVILIGLVTLLVTYNLVRRVFDRKVALVTLLLFAIDPSFIFANKLDWGPVSLMLALEVASLYFFWRWMNEGKRRFLGISGLLLGLGLYNKVIFIWHIVALCVALFLCFREKAKRLWNWRNLAVVLVPFLAGCLPLIAFNIAIPWGTFHGEKVVTQDWPSSLHYRYLLFRGTLDGSDVYYLINGQDPGDAADLLKSRAGTKFDLFISGLAAFPRIRAALTPIAVEVALALVLILWSVGRLEKKREILFFLCQLIVIAILICITAEATGAHHAIALYPFPHILIGFAIAELSRLLERAAAATTAVRAIVILCVAPLVLTELSVDARYLKSFQVEGGIGAWSDAIYQLAAFARRYPEKTFLLMDWGFSTQLLLLSKGRIKKRECSVHDYIGEERIAHMGSLLSSMNSLLVFHPPPFQTYPNYEAFKTALDKYGLEARHLKTFFQRDGRPIYLIYEVMRPEAKLLVDSGKFFYLREGEDFDAQLGGGVDLKEGASGNKALGNYWGSGSHDFALYRFTLPRKISDARVYLRYAFESPNPRQYYLLLDGGLVDAVTLPPTSGYGYTADQWRLFEVTVGTMEQGDHELKLMPASNGQTLNLDYFYVCEGRFRLDAKSHKQ